MTAEGGAAGSDSPSVSYAIVIYSFTVIFTGCKFFNTIRIILYLLLLVTRKKNFQKDSR